MTLGEIIEKEYKNLVDARGCIYVDYRTYTPDGEDIFTGACVITNTGDIVSLDHDTYSMNDEFIKYEIQPGDDNILVCWYESEWLNGK